jgi:hypothetical protein
MPMTNTDTEDFATWRIPLYWALIAFGAALVGYGGGGC